jgi:hypothetical protein
MIAIEGGAYKFPARILGVFSFFITASGSAARDEDK